MEEYFDLFMNAELSHIIQEEDNTYGIRVVERGYSLFFRENNKGLICLIDAEHKVIYKTSVKLWKSNNQKLNKEEKIRILDLIIKYYKQIYKVDLIVH
jgi:hypothetical protein